MSVPLPLLSVSSSAHLVLHGLVYLPDQPGEGAAVHGLRQGVPHVDRVVDGKRAENLHRDNRTQVLTFVKCYSLSFVFI